MFLALPVIMDFRPVALHILISRFTPRLLYFFYLQKCCYKGLNRFVFYVLSAKYNKTVSFDHKLDSDLDGKCYKKEGYLSYS